MCSTWNAQCSKCNLAIWLALFGYSLNMCSMWYQDLQACNSVAFFDILDCAVACLKTAWIDMPRNSKQGGSAYIAGIGMSIFDRI
jgi:hypothetical protein